MLMAGMPAATPPPPPPCSQARKRSWFSDNGNEFDAGVSDVGGDDGGDAGDVDRLTSL